MSVNAELTYRARVGDALDLLHRVLYPYIEREMRLVYRERWEREARAVLHGKDIETWDTSDLLTLLYTKFHQVFREVGHEGRSWVSLLREIRKKWAHQGTLSLDETRRTLETAILLMRAIGAEAEARRLEPQVLALMQEELAMRQGPGVAADPDRVARTRAAIEALKGEVAKGEVPKGEEMEAEAPSGLLAERVHAGLQKVRALFRKPPSEPLELRRSLLDAIEHAAEPYRRDFVFNRLVVHVLVPDGRARRRYEAALEGQPEAFPQAVLRRLAEAGIPAPGTLNVGWKLHRTPPQRLQSRFAGQPFYVELLRRRLTGTATLKVVRGRATREAFVIRSGGPVTIGRQAEVTDERGRVVWRNAVAFLDYEDPRLDAEEQHIHATISRVHARIQYDEADALFRLYDEQSTCGTSVVREGFLVPFQVKQQPVALQHGDLIYFGKACVRFLVGRAR